MEAIPLKSEILSQIFQYLISAHIFMFTVGNIVSRYLYSYNCINDCYAPPRYKTHAVLLDHLNVSLLIVITSIWCDRILLTGEGDRSFSW